VDLLNEMKKEEEAAKQRESDFKRIKEANAHIARIQQLEEENKKLAQQLTYKEELSRMKSSLTPLIEDISPEAAKWATIISDIFKKENEKLDEKGYNALMKHTEKLQKGLQEDAKKNT